MKKILQKFIIIILLVLTCFNAFSPAIYVYATTEAYEEAKKLYEEEILTVLSNCVEDWVEDYAQLPLSAEEEETLMNYIKTYYIETETYFPEEIEGYQCWTDVQSLDLDGSELTKLKKDVNDFISSYSDGENLRKFIKSKTAEMSMQTGAITLEQAKIELNKLICEQVLSGEGTWHQKKENLVSAINEFSQKRTIIPNNKKPNSR